MKRCFRWCVCIFLGFYFGCKASSEEENALDAKLAEMVKKGLMSPEKLARLKRQLLSEGEDDDSSSEKLHQPAPEASSTRSDAGTSARSSHKTADVQKESDAPKKVDVDPQKHAGDHAAEDDLESKSQIHADRGSTDVDPAAKKPRSRPKSMEESMREFGIDPDQIAKLSKPREPTNINEFVAAAMQATSAQETAKNRDMEELEDQEEALKQKQLLDDEVHVEAEAEGEDALAAPRATAGQQRPVLPDSVRSTLSGILGKMGDTMDPEASALLANLLQPNAGLESGEGQEEEDDGSTEDLAGLLASIGSGRGTGMSAELEELEKERKERDERMEKADEERKVERERRQKEREAEHEKFEAEMAEREEKSKLDRAEFEEGRKKHAAYMEEMEERKKKAEIRREENEKKREEREDRMAAAMAMAGAEIAKMKDLEKKSKGGVREDL